MEQQDVRFKYYFDKEYDPEYVTGAFGGASPNGDLIINFYMDRMPIPYEVKQKVKEDGTLDDSIIPINPDSEDILVRRVVKNGVVLNLSTALSVYKWIKEQLIIMGVEESEL